jgi:hypothetical protein
MFKQVLTSFSPYDDEQISSHVINLASNIDDFEMFWKVNQRLIPVDDQLMRHIPLRLYLPDDCPVIQDRISPLKDDGKMWLLVSVRTHRPRLLQRF